MNPKGLVENCAWLPSGQVCHRRCERLYAFARIELVVLITIGVILAAILFSAIVKKRNTQTSQTCRNNLRDIGIAFRVWASNGDRFVFDISVENGGTAEYTNVAQHFQSISNGIGNVRLLTCPSLHTTPARDWKTLQNSNISYFVGICAQETDPQSLMGGDGGFSVDGKIPPPGRITITTNNLVDYLDAPHDKAWILHGDGSVGRIRSTNGFDLLIRESGVSSNIFDVP